MRHKSSAGPLNLTSESHWHEPFILYYDEECDGEQQSMEESLLKFTIQMAYDDINQKRKDTEITQYLVGEHESFHLNQFSDGEIYLKEIKFGSKQSKNDILGFETPREE